MIRFYESPNQDIVFERKMNVSFLNQLLTYLSYGLQLGSADDVGSVVLPSVDNG